MNLSTRGKIVVLTINKWKEFLLSAYSRISIDSYRKIDSSRSLIFFSPYQFSNISISHIFDRCFIRKKRRECRGIHSCCTSALHRNYPLSSPPPLSPRSFFSPSPFYRCFPAVASLSPFPPPFSPSTDTRDLCFLREE